MQASKAYKGAPIWKTVIGAQITSPPAVFRLEGESTDRVLFGYGGRSSSVGGVICLNADSGALLWRFEVGAGVEGGVALQGKCAVFGDQNGVATCVDAKTGELVWKVPLVGRISAEPAIANGLVFVGTSSGQLTCLNVTSGRIQQQSQIHSELVRTNSLHIAQEPRRRTPPVRGELYRLMSTHFSSDDLRQICFELSWSYDDIQGSSHKAKIRHLIELAEQHECVDDLLDVCRRERPNVKWYANLDQTPTSALTKDSSKRQAPGIASVASPLWLSHALFASLDGGMYLFDAGTGEVDQMYDTGAPVYCAPLVTSQSSTYGRSDTRVLLSSQAGELVHLQLRPQQLLWRVTASRAVSVAVRDI